MGTKRIDDGHQTKIGFSENPSVNLWEKTVTPPAIEGGGATDTTTMHNENWRTRSPKKLKTLTESPFEVAYSPAAYPDIVALINVNQLITIEWPDGDELQFWGWLDGFTPAALAEGAQATATCRIVASNQNDDGDEVAPVYVEVT